VHHLMKVAAGLAWLAVLGGCGVEPPPAQDAAENSSVAIANVNPGDGSIVVRYELTGTAVMFDGSYSEPADNAEHMVELRGAGVPWSRNFTLPPNRLFVAGLVAQGPNLEASITCKILRNGVVVVEETGPTVDCRAEIS
jgi:Mycobacterium membrane protein